MPSDPGQPPSVREAFDRTAGAYDRSRRQLLPCFDAFYGTVVALLRFPADATPRVLDLGAGTGLLTALLRDRFPEAEFTLVDVAPEMLHRARQRFGAEAPRIRIVEADMATVPIPHRYHAVVSALAIHHLSDPEKAALFRRIYAALVPGGVFVNAEQVLGPTPEEDAGYWRVWERESRALGATAEDIAMAWERMRPDRAATLDAQLAWLRDAGFRDVACHFQWQALAVYAGVKPPS